MARGSGKKGKSDGDGHDPEGPGLWKAYVRDIEPLSEEAPLPVVEAPGKRPRVKKAIEPVAATPALPKLPASAARTDTPQLDGRTDQKLRRGKVPIEGTLDLHGMTQQQAHEKLNDYIVRAHAGKKRCVMVITGKGKSGEGAGVLKQKFPLWVAMSPLKEVVLKIQPAIQQHGGSGAWYVYLKRQRDY